MTITLITQEEYDTLLSIQKEFPALTFQNNGYEYLNMSKLTEIELEKFKEAESILKKSIKGFSKFNQNNHRRNYMKDSTYWARQYTNFIERELQQRKSIYVSQAWSMAQEIEGLIDNEQKYLGDDPAGFILLLHINDLFNRFDPIGVYPQSRVYLWAMSKNWMHVDFGKIYKKETKITKSLSRALIIC